MTNLLQAFPLLMGAPAGTGEGQTSFPFIAFGLIIAIFYFLIIRPQSKKQKEAKKMLETLKKGDRVATIGGIRGKIENVKDDTVVIKVGDNTKMEFSKTAVATVLEQVREEKSESQ